MDRLTGPEHSDLFAITRDLQSAFPDAGRIAPLRRLGEGFSSTVVETASGVVFCIARSAAVGQRYSVEHAVLPLLRPYLPVAVPQPRWYLARSAAFPFGVIGYPKLPGKPLEMEDARSIAPVLAPQIAAILWAFHQIPPAVIPRKDDLTARQRAWRKQRAFVLPVLRAALHADEYQRVAGWWEALLKDKMMHSYRPVVQHGDLWFGNLLVNESRIVGLLDFENVGTGDPALDFVPQLYLGERFLRDVLSAYEKDAGPLDPGFAHRLEQLWALREFDGLAWAIQNGNREEFNESVEKIRKGPILSPFGLDGWASHP